MIKIGHINGPAHKYDPSMCYVGKEPDPEPPTVWKVKKEGHVKYYQCSHCMTTHNFMYETCPVCSRRMENYHDEL